MSSKKTASVAGRPGLSPVLPRVPLTLNNKVYNLCFDFNAMARLEVETGLNTFLVVDFQNLTAVTLRAMLYAMLLADQPEITLEEVGLLISLEIYRVNEIRDALVMAWIASRPEAEKDENPPVAEERNHKK